MAKARQKVTCKQCGKRIYKDEAFVFLMQGQVKVKYFCNEEECGQYIAAHTPPPKKPDPRKKVLEYLFDILECDEKDQGLAKKLREFSKTYPYDVLCEYLSKEFVELKRIISNKTFNDNAHKRNYLFVVINNHMDDFLFSEEEEPKIVEVDLNLPEKYKFRRSKMRRALIDVENEILEGDDEDGGVY